MEMYHLVLVLKSWAYSCRKWNAVELFALAAGVSINCLLKKLLCASARSRRTTSCGESLFCDMDPFSLFFHSVKGTRDSYHLLRLDPLSHQGTQRLPQSVHVLAPVAYTRGN